ncbi:MAG TPA: UDP-N-acetylglucosamine 2-epimerase (non-hydrolyzing) [Chthonomonadaceae bacterium]|nr:UDP-N-acetylglucosamine 2-epimerase (non-hydrolyzing) [Chthonomonadaceae bacterium]
MPETVTPARVLCVFGTRPDAVKMAPVVRELRRFPQDFAVRVVVTGQHREQLDQVLRVFDITPDHDLAIMQHGQTLAQITTRALEGLDADLGDHPADICLAQGDTTTTFVAGLAAFYHKVPFGHVEAGLRTHHRYDPFPEEMNRRLAGALATWHFAPTEEARQNLLAEGIDSQSVYVTGNTSIDALQSAAARPFRFEDPALRSLMEGDRRLILVTAHRRENWGAPMESIGRALARIAQEFADCEIIVALHKNPLVRETLCSLLESVPRVHLIEPPDYVPFVKLMQRSTLILTDSGGVQEEAPSLGVPILVLRRTTERPEGVTAGTAKLIGTDTETIVTEARLLLTDADARAEMARAVNPYGDGRAAERIVAILRDARLSGD